MNATGKPNSLEELWMPFTPNKHFKQEPRLFVAADLPAVFAEDVTVFGADRGRLLAHALVAAPEYAWCVASEDQTLSSA